MNALEAVVTMLRREAHAKNTTQTAKDMLLRASHAIDDIRALLIKVAREPRIDANDRPYLPLTISYEQGRDSLLRDINAILEKHGQF